MKYRRSSRMPSKQMLYKLNDKRLNDKHRSMM